MNFIYILTAASNKGETREKPITLYIFIPKEKRQQKMTPFLLFFI